jgi:hypothetical protein
MHFGAGEYVKKVVVCQSPATTVCCRRHSMSNRQFEKIHGCPIKTAFLLEGLTTPCIYANIDTQRAFCHSRLRDDSDEMTWEYG